MKKKSSRNSKQSSQESIEEIVDRILANGYLSPLEHLELTTIFLSDFFVTDRERRQINFILDGLQMGRLKFKD